MAKNVFTQLSDRDNNIQRNKFDWSHNNSFTAKLGYIYPLLSEILPANSKFECNSYLGLQFMPMQFPVQTPMKAKVSFFKVPLRALWNDYQDYVSNFRNDLEEPYIDSNGINFNKMFGQGQLGDYLNIPNVVYTGENADSIQLTRVTPVDNQLVPYASFNEDGFITERINNQFIPYSSANTISGTDFYTSVPLYSGCTYSLGDVPMQSNINYDFTNLFQSPFELIIKNNQAQRITPDYAGSIGDYYQNSRYITPFIGLVFQDSDFRVVHTSNITSNLSNFRYIWTSDSIQIGDDRIYTANLRFSFSNTSSIVVNIPNASSVKYITFVVGADFSIRAIDPQYSDEVGYFNLIDNLYQPFGPIPETISPTLAGQIGDYRVISLDNSPYYSSTHNPEGIKLLAYKARAYEAIYNAYFRYNRNNPFIYNGKPIYNKWLANYDGGADTYPYQLHKAHWEFDFLTTAVTSPQQGTQPLVGLTQYIDEVPTENGTNISYKMALVDEDGKKYSVNYVVDGNDATIKVGDVLPDSTNVGTLSFTQLMDSSNIGISIPDLRAVNSYQKFLELNMRKGYSYKDIIEGRFDCKVNYNELLIPEFIGGYTRDIQMNRVVSSVDTNLLTGDNPAQYSGTLGSLAGDAFLPGTDTPKINCFCDEESIIMCVFQVIPQPVYTQLLPKDYLYRDILDHFNPEFNNLGFQPIKYGEVCPLQLKLSDKSPDDTFGYQRPWYEYCSKTDTAHGLMRTELRNFIMNRNFAVAPELTQSFLLVDTEQLNDVFQIQDDTDKIIGQLYFKAEVELPIHRVAIPSLG